MDASLHRLSHRADTVLAEMLDAIGAATHQNDYPARIGMSADALQRLAGDRMRSQWMLRTCWELYDFSSHLSVWPHVPAFTDDDVAVVGFFLGKNTQRSLFR